MSTLDAPTRPTGLDPRGPRFGAALTAGVLLLVLLLAPSPLSTALLGLQAALFAWGAAAGLRRTPASWLFRVLVRPRLAPPAELEDPAPPRFAQVVGLVFAVVGLGALLAGLDVVGLVAVGLALVAALLNAVFGYCLGCEVYLLAKRLAPATR